MAQDFGSDFQFRSDQSALQSILSQEGVSYSQLMSQNIPSKIITPAKDVEKNSDQLEFFESKAGQIFFRKKVVAKKEHTPVRNPLATQKKNGFGRSFKELGPEFQLPRRMNFSGKKSGKFRTPLKSLDVVAGAVTAKKPSLRIPPIIIHRQSISERKAVPSGLPVPSHSSAARKMLFNKPHPVPAFQKPKQDGEHRFTKPSSILPPLTKLTRESFKHIPRESLAWMSQLPRESATFAELEKLMTEDDKKFANEDDTDSFEAMEKRMKTPSRGKLVPTIPLRITDNKENINTVESNKISDKAHHTEESDVLEDESPNIEKHERLGNELPVVSSLTNLSPLEVDISNKSAPAPSTPITTNRPASTLLPSAPHTPITQTPRHSLGTPLTPGLRSLSTTDLASNSNQQPVQIARSASVDNLEEVVSFSDLVSTDRVEGLLESLTEYEEQLNRFRQEQDELLKQEEELLNKIKQRKQQFRDLWGVSPLRINTMRTVLPVKPKHPEIEWNTENKEDDDPNITPGINNDNLIAESARRVRFNSGRNETRNLTPVSRSEFSPEGSSSSSLENSGIFETSRSNSSNQSFASLKSSLSFLQTPLPPKKRMLQNMPSDKQLVEPTPVALRKLSDRVMAQMDALNADSSEDTDGEVTEPGTFQEKLCF